MSHFTRWGMLHPGAQETGFATVCSGQVCRTMGFRANPKFAAHIDLLRVFRVGRGSMVGRDDKGKGSFPLLG